MIPKIHSKDSIDNKINNNEDLFKYYVCGSIIFLFISELIISYYILGLLAQRPTDRTFQQNDKLFQELLLIHLNKDPVKTLVQGYIAGVIQKNENNVGDASDEDFVKRKKRHTFRSSSYPDFLVEDTNRIIAPRSSYMFGQNVKELASASARVSDAEVSTAVEPESSSEGITKDNWFWLSGTSRVPVSQFTFNPVALCCVEWYCEFNMSTKEPF